MIPDQFEVIPLQAFMKMILYYFFFRIKTDMNNLCLEQHQQIGYMTLELFYLSKAEK